MKPGDYVKNKKSGRCYLVLSINKSWGDKIVDYKLELLNLVHKGDIRLYGEPHLMRVTKRILSSDYTQVNIIIMEK